MSDFMRSPRRIKEFLSKTLLAGAAACVVSSSAQDASAYKRQPPEAFKNAKITGYMAYQYDGEKNEIQAFRTDTDADSVMIAGECFDLMHEKGFSLATMPEAVDVIVFDEPGCGGSENNPPLEVGVLDCSADKDKKYDKKKDGEKKEDKKAPGGAAGEDDKPMQGIAGGVTGEKAPARGQVFRTGGFAESGVIHIEAESSYGPGWREVTLDGKKGMLYTGADNASCDKDAALRYKAYIPEDAEYTVRLNVADTDDGLAGVCVGAETGVSGLRLLESHTVPGLWNTLTSPAAALEKGERVFSFYGAKKGTALESVTISRALKNSTLSPFRTGALAVQGCDFIAGETLSSLEANNPPEEMPQTPIGASGFTDPERDMAMFSLPPMQCDGKDGGVIATHIPPMIPDNEKVAVSEPNYIYSPVTILFRAEHEKLCHEDYLKTPAEDQPKIIATIMSAEGGEPVKARAFFAGNAGTAACPPEDILIGKGAGEESCECGNIWGVRYSPKTGGDLSVMLSSESDGVTVPDAEITVAVSDEPFMDAQFGGSESFSERGMLSAGKQGYFVFEGMTDSFFVPAGFGQPIGLLGQLQDGMPRTFTLNNDSGDECSFFDYIRYLANIGVNAQHVNIPMSHWETEPDDEGAGQHISGYMPASRSVVTKFSVYNMLAFMNSHGVAPIIEIDEAQGFNDNELVSAFGGLNSVIWLGQRGSGIDAERWKEEVTDVQANPNKAPAGFHNVLEGMTFDMENILGSYVLPALRAGAGALTLSPKAEGTAFYLPWEHVRPDAVVAMTNVSRGVSEALNCLGRINADDMITAGECSESESAETCVSYMLGSDKIEMTIDPVSLEVMHNPPLAEGCGSLAGDMPEDGADGDNMNGDDMTAGEAGGRPCMQDSDCSADGSVKCIINTVSETATAVNDATETTSQATGMCETPAAQTPDDMSGETPAQGQGAPCDEMNECAPGQTCEIPEGETAGTCAGEAQEVPNATGVACSPDTPCPEGQACVTAPGAIEGMCSGQAGETPAADDAASGEGAACATDADCAGGTCNTATSMCDMPADDAVSGDDAASPDGAATPADGASAGDDDTAGDDAVSSDDAAMPADDAVSGDDAVSPDGAATPADGASAGDDDTAGDDAVSSDDAAMPADDAVSGDDAVSPDGAATPADDVSAGDDDTAGDDAVPSDDASMSADDAAGGDVSAPAEDDETGGDGEAGAVEPTIDADAGDNTDAEEPAAAAEPAPEGAPCEAANAASCVEGLICVDELGQGTGICMAAPAEGGAAGEVCDPANAASCAEGLTCVDQAGIGSGTCQAGDSAGAGAAEGAVCDPADAASCAEGLTCTPDETSGEAVCAPASGPDLSAQGTAATLNELIGGAYDPSAEQIVNGDAIGQINENGQLIGSGGTVIADGYKVDNPDAPGEQITVFLLPGTDASAGLDSASVAAHIAPDNTLQAGWIAREASPEDGGADAADATDATDAANVTDAAAETPAAQNLAGDQPALQGSADSLDDLNGALFNGVGFVNDAGETLAYIVPSSESGLESGGLLYGVSQDTPIGLLGVLDAPDKNENPVLVLTSPEATLSPDGSVPIGSVLFYVDGATASVAPGAPAPAVQ